MDHPHHHFLRYHDWLVQYALPFWAKAAINPAGGFHEKLTMQGQPVTNCARRVRVQARLTQVYSMAAYYGWYENAEAVSDHGWHFLTRDGMAGSDDRAGIAHLLNPDGSVLDGHRDTYAQAFLLLAAAWRVKAFDDRAARDILEQTVGFLDSRLSHPAGGWKEGHPETLPRRQNPHMHLIEAFMTCHEATGENIYLEKANQIFNLFTDHFYDMDSGLLLEFFNDRFQPDTKSGHLIEPGHMMEWVWLLDWYRRLTGTQTRNYADRLYAQAEHIGLNEKTGLLFDQVTKSGDVMKETSRLWTLTELIKASMVNGKLEAANGLTGLMLDKYLSVPVAGGWSDTCDNIGVTVPGFMETSSFYHLIGVGAEMKRLGLNEQTQPSA
ncbi:AGE family epimerase/isomerase [Parvularcula sp. IMCC14364]|uniref:AGE family epimerase/isomerase n=1 Tax=Parvularcula sp. IMCC14364 TaxID=3067902 RepID=UPI0027405438|nr:AGE family epimerase/isomerase [Parvularcula sp. IMCC14364]